MNTRSAFTRFCLVGALNTTIDAGVFTALHTAGMTITAANFCSTSLGLLTSFVLNTRYTFQQNRLSRRKIMQFFAVTLTGLWLVQPAIITSCLAATKALHLHTTNPIMATLAPKLIAIGCTFIWNYLWYSRLVYAKD